MLHLTTSLIRRSPRWSAAANRYERGDDLTPVASAARTASGNSGAQDASGFSVAELLLDVTAASGTTPSLTVTIEESHDGTTWRTVSAFAAKTAVGTERKSFSIAGRYYRVSWAITGTTPSFTFSVSGTAK
jgi:hypothetical protein